MLRTLVETNCSWLEQAIKLLESIDNRIYATSPVGLEPHRAGGHLRHILDFYECLLEGCGSGYVDYDARGRDVEVESDRIVAIGRLGKTIERLRELESMTADRRLWVKAEASDSREGILNNRLATSLSRELQVLSSHTVHHFALMAIALKGHGVALPAGFGVAPSTLKHQARQAA